MAVLQPVAHGGALAAAIQKYGGKKEDWLDLSTGINPSSAPIPIFASHQFQALPDSDAMDACVSAARGFYDISGKASVIAAAGVQALIQLLPKLRPNEKAAVLGPTYGEYAHIFQNLGHGCRIVQSLTDLTDERVVVIVNPNNPDGRLIEPDYLLELAGTLASKGGLLVVDEAFCDLMPEMSVAHHAGTPGLLVLKSFGKFFGLAGLRLGFAAGHQNDIDILKNNLGPWSVSTPALLAGTQCYSSKDLKTKTTNMILQNAKAQAGVLARAGLNPIADVGLFQLAAHSKAKSIHEQLAKQYILTRIFADHSDWLRFGLCKNQTERKRLNAALDVCLSTL